jgi:hypothetical protein
MGLLGRTTPEITAGDSTLPAVAEASATCVCEPWRRIIEKSWPRESPRSFAACDLLPRVLARAFSRVEGSRQVAQVIRERQAKLAE